MKIFEIDNKNEKQSNKFVEEFLFNQTDFENFGVSPYSVLSIFQDVATKHAEALGVGFSSMLQKKLLWVTMRIKFEVLKDINANEKYKIVTYPSGKNMMEFDRDYVIFNENGDLILKGQSKWCLINSETRRISRMIDGIELANEQPIFDGRFLKTESFEPRFLPDYSYKIVPGDIDNNRHTNNTVYAKMVENLLKNETKKIKFFQLNFLKECVLGNRVDVYSQQFEDGFVVLGKLCERDISFTSKIKFG